MAKEGRARTRRGRVVASVAGAVALGVGAGLALERVLSSRSSTRPDPLAEEPYGGLVAERSWETVSFDGATLFAEEWGPPRSGRGVIFLHGYCLDRTIWHHQMLISDKERRRIFVDARHHGRSKGGAAEPNIPVLADDLHRVLEGSRLKAAVLVGHSMGGMTALEFCRRHPEMLNSKVRGLVLANTTYTDVAKTLFGAEVIGPLERRTSQLIERLLNAPRAGSFMRLRGNDLSELLVRLFGFGPGASETQVGYVRQLLSVFPSPPLVEMLRGLRAFDMDGALGSINVPVLIVAGGDDRLTTVRASEKMHADIAGSRLVVLPDAGHTSMLERHIEFNSMLMEFLDEVLPASRRSRSKTDPA